ncbi:MAG: type I-C CRISPR-associated protein Cas5c [Pseudomonadales bacterium]
MGFCIEVTGDFACFTRPEMKVERVSYDVITPSAARSIFESILWKPAIEWHIHKIEVLKPVRWINLRRNEVGAVLSVANAKKAMSRNGDMALYVEDERQQRAGLFLRDVGYRLHASFSMTDKAGVNDNAGKFTQMFKRRAKKGQCINQPYLGCREFSCDFRLVEEGESQDPAIDESRALGWMLYDLDYSNPSDPSPLFYNPTLELGAIRVPDRHSEEVRG